MRLVFFGTPADAVPALEALHVAGHDIALVVTQPDRRRGRGSEPSPSPVREAAEALGLPVLTPEKSRRGGRRGRRRRAPRSGSWSRSGSSSRSRCSRRFPHGFVNVHFSLLPRWRGAAPVERAMLAGDRRDRRLHHGARGRARHRAGVRAARDTDRCAGDRRRAARAAGRRSGTDLLVETLPAVPTARPQPQVGEPTYAEKLTVDEFELDWEQPADDLARTVRSGNPRPGAWTTDHGTRLKVWRARALSAGIDAEPGTVFGHTRVATGEGALELIEVQPEGRRTMAANAWLAGRRARPHPSSEHDGMIGT